MAGKRVAKLALRRPRKALAHQLQRRGSPRGEDDTVRCAVHAEEREHHVTHLRHLRIGGPARKASAAMGVAIYTSDHLIVCPPQLRRRRERRARMIRVDPCGCRGAAWARSHAGRDAETGELGVPIGGAERQRARRWRCHAEHGWWCGACGLQLRACIGRGGVQ